MSLPVFNAISFQRIFEKGGHSRPWVVLVNANEIPKPFVVKLYRTLDIEARNKMTAEVMGNVLANHFGLNRPMAAIINFSDEFRMTLNKECEDILCQTDERVKFGTELIEPAFLFNPGISRYQTSKYILPDSLYAFDYFICNRDRNLEKPNLILNNDKAFLIDHEMGLEIDNSTFERFENSQWDNRYRYHIFYNLLRNKKDKSTMFDEFLFYLQSLRLNSLNSYFSQLESHGFITNKDTVINYWQSIINNTMKFKTILLNSLR